MNGTMATYKNHRFPIEIVARAMWLYFRFNVSLREVEEMMLERGVAVSYETIRRWCRAHGADYARRLRRKSASPSDIWHLGELVVRINGRRCWLWVRVRFWPPVGLRTCRVEFADRARGVCFECERVHCFGNGHRQSVAFVSVERMPFLS